MTASRLLSTFGKLRRGRLFLLLVLCVLVPTIPLGYLVVQSMVGQSEGVSRKITDKLKRDGGVFATAVTAGVSECEADVEERLGGYLSLNDTVTEISEGLAACAFFESFFILDSRLNPLFPFGSVCEEAPEGGSSAPAAAGFSDEMKKGRRLEFEAGDLKGAIEKYDLALSHAGRTKYRAVAENAIARCYLKDREYEKAREHYSAILKGDGSCVLYGGLSMDLLARYQPAMIEEMTGNGAHAAEQFLYILRTLARGELAGNAYEAIFYASMIEERMRALLADAEVSSGYRREFEEISREWNHRRSLIFQASDLPESVRFDFRKALGEDAARGAKFRNLTTSSRGEETVLLYCTKGIPDVAGPALIAIVLDGAALQREVGKVLEDQLKTETDVYAAVYDSEGQVVAEGGDEGAASGYEIEASLAPVLPDWRLKLAYKKEGVLFEVAAKERMTRFTSIFFLAAIIFLGLYVAHRSVKRDTELARLKSDFVSRVSHELRTPLATIRALGEMLEMGAVSSREKEQQYFSLIASESERLSRLIDNVLDFSKIGTDRKTYTFRTADICRTVSNTVLAFRQYVHSEGFDIELEEDGAPVHARIDEDAISQALINLLDNAVKFSRDEKVALVKLHATAKEIRISVADRGVGIAPEIVDKIFDQFYRPKESAELSGKGAGIGLAIVKHVAEAHGGRVEVRNRKGGGSVFTLVLPASGAAS